MKKIIGFVFAALMMPCAIAQSLKTDFVEVDLGREFGFFIKSPAVLRAITVAPTNVVSREAILFFVGWPGTLWLPEKFDAKRFLDLSKNSRFHMFRELNFFASRDITLVVVDCPTDQWGGGRANNPTACGDSYRSSQAHADDVRKLIAHLKANQGIEKFYVMGHSYGSISSRWLSINLGKEFEGSIHSASISQKIGLHGPQGPYGPNLQDFGSSVSKIDMTRAASPFIFIHNAEDKCGDTQYPAIRQLVPDKLITVKGGIAEGDPCGGGHLHSYQGKWPEVLDSIYKWIKTREISPYVGD